MSAASEDLSIKPNVPFLRYSSRCWQLDWCNWVWDDMSRLVTSAVLYQDRRDAEQQFSKSYPNTSLLFS